MSHFALNKYRKPITQSVDAIMSSDPVELLTIQQQDLEDEFSATGWDSSPFTGTIDTTYAKTGTHSLMLTRTGGSSAFMTAAQDFSNRPAASAGQTFRCTGWIYADSGFGGPDLQLIVRPAFYNVNTFISYGSNTSPTVLNVVKDSWNYNETITTAPTNTTSVRATVQVSTIDFSAFISGYSCWYDDMHLFRL